MLARRTGSDMPLTVPQRSETGTTPPFGLRMFEFVKIIPNGLVFQVDFAVRILVALTGRQAVDSRNARIAPLTAAGFSMIDRWLPPSAAAMIRTAAPGMAAPGMAAARFSIDAAEKILAPPPMTGGGG